MPVFLTAEWRDLVLVNYQVDPAVLAPRVPAGTELDTFDGRALVSLVGFRFLDTRILGVRLPFHGRFLEVNLRFYVRRHTPGGVRRGVVFVREIVARRAIAWGARLLYGEPYVTRAMKHDVALPSAPAAASLGHATYEWRWRGRWQRLSIETERASEPAPPGSEAEFITEHYWGYTRRRDGSTMEYEVEHPRWRVWPASRAMVDCDVAVIYGADLAPFLERPPHSAFAADGSAVAVHRGTRIAGG